MNRALFRWLASAAVLSLLLSFLLKGLGFTQLGMMEGARFRLLVIGVILLLWGLGCRFFGNRLLRLFEVPASRTEWRLELKRLWGVAGRWCRDHRYDLFWALILFIGAVIEVSVYASMFLSSGIRGAAAHTGSINPLVISGDGFSHVPLAWILIRIGGLLSVAIPSLSPYGVLFGVIVVLLYGIFRLGMGRSVSLLCTLSFMVSSVQLDHLIPFWDKYFARAPFVFCLVLIMGILVSRRSTPRGVTGWAVLAGFILGEGLMFRPDLMIFGIMMALTLFFFLPAGPEISRRARMVAILFLATATLLSYSSCPRCLLSRPATAHAFLNGSTPFFNDRLGLISPKYDWNYLFLDEFTSSMSFAQGRVFQEDLSYSVYGPVDEQARRVALTFPADTLARFYGATLKVLEIPFTYVLHPAAVRDRALIAFYEVRGALIGALAGGGIWLFAISLLLMSLRQAVFCLMLLPALVLIAFLHLIGYYFFYLEFISYWTMGFAVHQGTATALRLTRVGRKFGLFTIGPGKIWKLPRIRTAGLVAGTGMVLLLALVFARHIQEATVSRLVHQYGSAALDRIPVELQPVQNGNVLLTSQQSLKPVVGKGFRSEELMAKFNPETCGGGTVWLTLRYSGTSHRRMDFSRSMGVEISAGSADTRLFFPAMAQKDVYAEGYASHFAGIELAADQAKCVEGLYRVADPKDLGMLLTLQLPLEGPAYTQLADWEGSSIHAVPGGMSQETAARFLSEPLMPLREEDLDYRDPILTLVPAPGGSGYLRVNGHARDNSSLNPLFPINGPEWKLAGISHVNADALLVNTDLMITRPKWHKKGSAFVARGALYSGGVAFTLVHENRPSGLAIVANPGRFDVILTVPQDGYYSVGMTNYVAYYNTMENRLTTKAGWVEQ